MWSQESSALPEIIREREARDIHSWTPAITLGDADRSAHKSPIRGAFSPRALSPGALLSESPSPRGPGRV